MKATKTKTKAPAAQRFGDRIFLYNPRSEWLVFNPITIARECSLIIAVIISGLMLGESNKVETKSAAQSTLSTLLCLFATSLVLFLLDFLISTLLFDFRRSDPLNIIIWHQIGPRRRRSRFIIIIYASLYLMQVVLAAASVHVISRVTSDGHPVWVELPRANVSNLLFAMAILSLFLTILASLHTWARLFFVRGSLASRWAIPPATTPFRPSNPDTTTPPRSPADSGTDLDTLYQQQLGHGEFQQQLLQQLAGPVKQGTQASRNLDSGHPALAKPSPSLCTANLRYWYAARQLCATCWIIAWFLAQVAVVVTQAVGIIKIANSERSCGSTGFCAWTIVSLFIWLPVLLGVVSAVRLRVALHKNVLCGVTGSYVVAGVICISLALSVSGVGLLVYTRKWGHGLMNDVMDEWTFIAVFGLVAESVLMFVFMIICGAFFLPEPRMRGYANNLFLHLFVQRQRETTLYR
ncbi:hypothetical protein OQA88_11839 [Cercophora sp. LCS_1]